MDFNVIIPRQVLKSIMILDEFVKTKIITKLSSLEKDSKPIGSLKLKGYNNQFRIRVGDYRIRYFIDNSKNEVLILDIAHRKDVYKRNN